MPMSFARVLVAALFATAHGATNVAEFDGTFCSATGMGLTFAVASGDICSGSCLSAAYKSGSWQNLRPTPPTVVVFLHMFDS